MRKLDIGLNDGGRVYRFLTVSIWVNSQGKAASSVSAFVRDLTRQACINLSEKERNMSKWDDFEKEERKGCKGEGLREAGVQAYPVYVWCVYVCVCVCACVRACVCKWSIIDIEQDLTIRRLLVHHYLTNWASKDHKSLYIYSHPQTDLFRSIRTHQCG